MENARNEKIKGGIFRNKCFKYEQIRKFHEINAGRIAKNLPELSPSETITKYTQDLGTDLTETNSKDLKIAKQVVMERLRDHFSK